MTSVPKPLKFLSPLYPNMVAAYEAEKDAALKVSFHLKYKENACFFMDFLSADY